MFTNNTSSKTHFLQQTKAARKERANEKDREIAACCIQKYVRIWLNRLHFTTQTLKDVDNFFPSSLTNIDNIEMRPSLTVYEVINKFLIVYKKERDKERMENICRYIVKSLNSESLHYSYIGVALLKEYSISWIAQIKKILLRCCHELEDLNPERPSDNRSILSRLHTFVSFTSISTWSIIKLPEIEKLKTGMNQLCANITGFLIENNLYSIMQVLLIKGLCKNHNALQPIALTAITNLTIRPLILSKMSEKLMQKFLVHIFSIPSLVHHLNYEVNASCMKLYKQHQILTKIITYLKVDINLKTLFETLKGNYILCLLANLIELANIENDEIIDLYYPCFTTILKNSFEFCQRYVAVKKSNTTSWHPILGWFEHPEDHYIQEVTSIVKKQLSCLWIGNIITELICKPLEEILKDCSQKQNSKNVYYNASVFHRTFLDFRMKKDITKFCHKLNNSKLEKIFIICSLYYTAIHTLQEIKSIILTGICYKDKKILYNLWMFLKILGPNCGLKLFIDLFPMNIEHISPEFQTLILFCECMTHYITILDDIEMYEQQDPFSLSDYTCMSYFLNQFLYKSICNNLVDPETVLSHPFFIPMHSLLMAIYRRDCQRPFCTEGHWLIKEVRLSSFLVDSEKRKHSLNVLLTKMPHIVPHPERVILFRKYITEEKLLLASHETTSVIGSTTITVHRTRIVEDGYRQLSTLSPQALKGTIRVRFINEQGLDEAGIDQDGVFKEYLEETIKRVFDPSLNLFKMTSENRLYPSPTSFVQENHLLLFEFIGRMLGKAVYEGIVVDVPFASFFVSQFCGQTCSLFYSCLDELNSLDQDLYRSLTLVKHYEGDVSQLELTFSLNENIMGKIVTHELKPGGKVVPVTNENKINYIHLVAQFRMYVQIKEQIAAFTKGFRSIINSDWLCLFSTPEWQRLIAGDNVPLDLRDLRKHTQYYGGFHDKHRVICWLWDILAKDFSETEQKLFLKFVTSCSKSPLLGFAHLEPPFSIRCVEVCDDEDTGDTVGSVIRGFFTIRKKDPQNRLPTSSTCFNLLKLPNYKKKSILREKLRYAVTSNTGFELS